MFDAHFAQTPGQLPVPCTTGVPPAVHRVLIRSTRPENDAPPDYYARWGRLVDARPISLDNSPLDSLVSRPSPQYWIPSPSNRLAPRHRTRHPPPPPGTCHRTCSTSTWKTCWKTLRNLRKSRTLGRPADRVVRRRRCGVLGTPAPHVRRGDDGVRRQTRPGVRPPAQRNLDRDAAWVSPPRPGSPSASTASWATTAPGCTKN